MSETNDDTRENIAETLARVLPPPRVLVEVPTPSGIEGLHLAYAAVPDEFTLVPVKEDLEPFLPNPRKTKARADFADAESFIAYVQRHKQDRTVVWCAFDPQKFALSFVAVIDEHASDKAGWRHHQAVFRPDMSAEWKAWLKLDRQPQSQLAFGEWIEEHDADIHAAEGMPSSLEMLTMATNFVATQEKRLKSAIRLQSGGVKMEYVDTDDDATTATMTMFERFAIGIPVFHAGSAWNMKARLKYTARNGAVTFRYELVRPDQVYQYAAKEVIGAVRTGIGDMPLLMGVCN